MNLRDQILSEHSKINAQAIANWIGTNKQRFEAIMQLFFYDEVRVVQRAAYTLSMIADENMELFTPYLPQMIEHMQDPKQHNAVRRNVVRILQDIDIPEAQHAAVLNACFDYLADPNEAIAVRAFSMTVLNKLSAIYPEIKQELKVLIEEGLEHEPSPGFRNRGLKTLATL